MQLRKIEQMITVGDLKIHTVSLPAGVYGFAYHSREKRYHIFISEALMPDARYEVLMHEIYHVLEDMPKHKYILGLNMQHEEIEKPAEHFARRIKNNLQRIGK